LARPRDFGRARSVFFNTSHNSRRARVVLLLLVTCQLPQEQGVEKTVFSSSLTVRARGTLMRLAILTSFLVPTLHLAQMRELATPPEKPLDTLHQGATHKALSPDGKVLACGDGRAEVELFDTATGKKLGTLGLKLPLKSLVFSPDGKYLAVGSGRY